MGYFFHHKSLNQICCHIFRLFLKIWVYFQAYKNLYSPKKWEMMTKIKRKKELKDKKNQFQKKYFGSDTDTEIGPWFRSPIPKTGFGRTLGGEEGRSPPFPLIPTALLGHQRLDLSI